MTINLKPYQVVESYLRSVHPAQPTHPQMVVALKQSPKWVSNAAAKLKNMGLAQVEGRVKLAKWRLTSMQYENTSSNDVFDLDPNARSYVTLAAMQAVARERLTKGLHA